MNDPRELAKYRFWKEFVGPINRHPIVPCGAADLSILIARSGDSALSVLDGMICFWDDSIFRLMEKAQVDPAGAVKVLKYSYQYTRGSQRLLGWDNCGYPPHRHKPGSEEHLLCPQPRVHDMLNDISRLILQVNEAAGSEDDD
jgi:hypothetical protein